MRLWLQEQAEQMEKEKKSRLAEMEQLKEENAIVKHELADRLREILHLRVGFFTLSLC